MATKETKDQNQASIEEGLKVDNMLGDKAIVDALAEIDKEKDEKKKSEAKKTLCLATYMNRKTVLQLQQRRREDDITKEKLDATKKLLERYIGFETEIKDGKLVPTKKKIEGKDRLTAAQYEKELDNLDKENRKKIEESNKVYNDAVRELEDSYEAQYRYSFRRFW